MLLFLQESKEIQIGVQLPLGTGFSYLNFKKYIYSKQVVTIFC
jgi:hypothetical protein